MSSSTERARGLVLINGRAFPVKEVLAALERQAMTSVRVVRDELWIGNERIRPFTKTSAEQVMMLTCFGSLAFCCDLSRKCNLRDEAIHLLGMTKEQYRAIQRECHQNFLRHSERRWPEDIVITPHSDPSSSHLSSYSGNLTPIKDRDPWRDQAITSSQGDTQSISRPSDLAIDLGGIFDTPHDQGLSTPTISDPYSGMKTRPFSETFDDSLDNWRVSSRETSTQSSTPKSSSQGFCIYCGQDIRPGNEFCSRCGRSQK